MSNYGINAINTLVDKALQTLDYSSTETGTIVGVEQAQMGIYTVRVKGSKIRAYSAIKDLALEDRVLIINSQDDTSLIKIILCKVENENNENLKDSNITFLTDNEKIVASTIIDYRNFFQEVLEDDNSEYSDLKDLLEQDSHVFVELYKKLKSNHLLSSKINLVSATAKNSNDNYNPFDETQTIQVEQNGNIVETQLNVSINNNIWLENFRSYLYNLFNKLKDIFKNTIQTILYSLIQMPVIGNQISSIEDLKNFLNNKSDLEIKSIFENNFCLIENNDLLEIYDKNNLMSSPLFSIIEVPYLGQGNSLILDFACNYLFDFYNDFSEYNTIPEYFICLKFLDANGEVLGEQEISLLENTVGNIFNESVMPTTCKKQIILSKDLLFDEYNYLKATSLNISFKMKIHQTEAWSNTIYNMIINDPDYQEGNEVDVINKYLNFPSICFWPISYRFKIGVLGKIPNLLLVPEFELNIDEVDENQRYNNKNYLDLLKNPYQIISNKDITEINFATWFFQNENDILKRFITIDSNKIKFFISLNNKDFEEDNEYITFNNSSSFLQIDLTKYESYSLFAEYTDDDGVTYRSNILTFVTQEEANTRIAAQLGYSIQVTVPRTNIFTEYNSILPDVYENNQHLGQIGLYRAGQLVDEASVKSIKWTVGSYEGANHNGDSQIWLFKDEDNRQKQTAPVFQIENSSSIGFQFFDRFVHLRTTIYCEVELANNQKLNMRTYLDVDYAPIDFEGDYAPIFNIENHQYPIIYITLNNNKTQIASTSNLTYNFSILDKKTQDILELTEEKYKISYYKKTEDTSITQGTDYYERVNRSDKEYNKIIPAAGSNPKAKGYYVKVELINPPQPTISYSTDDLLISGSDDYLNPPSFSTNYINNLVTVESFADIGNPDNLYNYSFFYELTADENYNSEKDYYEFEKVILPNDESSFNNYYIKQNNRYIKAKLLGFFSNSATYYIRKNYNIDEEFNKNILYNLIEPKLTDNIEISLNKNISDPGLYDYFSYINSNGIKASWDGRYIVANINSKLFWKYDQDDLGYTYNIIYDNKYDDSKTYYLDNSGSSSETDKSKIEEILSYCYEDSDIYISTVDEQYISGKNYYKFEKEISPQSTLFNSYYIYYNGYYAKASGSFSDSTTYYIRKDYNIDEEFNKNILYNQQINYRHCEANTSGTIYIAQEIDKNKDLSYKKSYFFKTSDTALIRNKTYYEKVNNGIKIVNSPTLSDISDYYELKEDDANKYYILTKDTNKVSGKNYFTKTTNNKIVKVSDTDTVTTPLSGNGYYENLENIYEKNGNYYLKSNSTYIRSNTTYYNIIPRSTSYDLVLYEQIPNPQPNEAEYFNKNIFVLIMNTNRSDTMLKNEGEKLASKDFNFTKKVAEYNGFYNRFAKERYSTNLPALGFLNMIAGLHIPGPNSTYTSQSLNNYLTSQTNNPVNKNNLYNNIIGEETTNSSNNNQSQDETSQNNTNNNYSNDLNNGITEQEITNSLISILSLPLNTIQSQIKSFNIVYSSLDLAADKKIQALQDSLFIPRFSAVEPKLSNGQHIYDSSFWRRSIYINWYLPNCTCYAWGRYAEVAARGNLNRLTEGLNHAKARLPDVAISAGKWVANFCDENGIPLVSWVKTIKDFKADPDKRKYLGAVIEWSGHVGIIEYIDNDIVGFSDSWWSEHSLGRSYAFHDWGNGSIGSVSISNNLRLGDRRCLGLILQ